MPNNLLTFQCRYFPIGKSYNLPEFIIRYIKNMSSYIVPYLSSIPSILHLDISVASIPCNIAHHVGLDLLG